MRQIRRVYVFMPRLSPDRPQTDLTRLSYDLVESREEEVRPRQTLPAWNVAGPLDHLWRWRAKLPDRYGQPCRVLACGRMNSCLVEFSDGHRVLTSRWAVRRVKSR